MALFLGFLALVIILMAFESNGNEARNLYLFSILLLIGCFIAWMVEINKL